MLNIVQYINLIKKINDIGKMTFILLENIKLMGLTEENIKLIHG
jgi:hypothetical protein